MEFLIFGVVVLICITYSKPVILLYELKSTCRFEHVFTEKNRPIDLCLLDFVNTSQFAQIDKFYTEYVTQLSDIKVYFTNRTTNAILFGSVYEKCKNLASTKLANLKDEKLYTFKTKEVHGQVLHLSYNEIYNIKKGA